jgi:hypothetical protein
MSGLKSARPPGEVPAGAFASSRHKLEVEFPGSGQAAAYTPPSVRILGHGRGRASVGETLAWLTSVLEKLSC